MEKEAVRVLGSFLGHDSIVAGVLSRGFVEELFCSTYQDRCHAAIMGAAEAAKEKEWLRLMDDCERLLSDPALSIAPGTVHTWGDSVDDADEQAVSFQERRAKHRDRLSESLAAAIVFGYLSSTQ